MMVYNALTLEDLEKQKGVLLYRLEKFKKELRECVASEVSDVLKDIEDCKQILQELDAEIVSREGWYFEYIKGLEKDFLPGKKGGDQ